MRTLASIAISAVIVALIAWAYNQITFRPSDHVQPTLTLHGDIEIPKEVIQDILTRHGDYISGATQLGRFEGARNPSFPTYLLFQGFYLAIGIFVFLGIQRVMEKQNKARLDNPLQRRELENQP